MNGQLTLPYLQSVDPINGPKRVGVMQAFDDNLDADAVFMIGEIGGPPSRVSLAR